MGLATVTTPPSRSTGLVPVPGPPAAPQQPVIINQYFGVQGPQAQAAGPAPANEPQAAGEPIGNPQNYYLIAYKNHADLFGARVLGGG